MQQGRRQGERGEGGNSPPPETEKMLYKNGVISESSIFSNKFSIKNKNKKNKKSMFLNNLHQKISKFFQKFQLFV